jgi:hypothetical protein
MNRSELKEKIKSIVKNSNLTSPSSHKKIDIDNPTSISLDTARFPVLTKFPTLQDTIIKILTYQYDLFIKDIEWVAPRPTTFRVILANDQVFYLIYTDRTWIGKVEGKKYYLLNIGEEQNCVESVARILSYGTKVEKPIEETPPPTEPPSEPSTEQPPVPPESKLEPKPEVVPPQA